MSELALRISHAIWGELEAQADNSGGYIDRNNGTIEGHFAVEALAEELVDRFGLVAEL
jgi:hypothetical protein